MKALEHDVLQSALEIQDALLGPTVDFAPRRSSNQLSFYDPFTDLTTDERDTLHAINGLTNSSWFFHSPLQYWSCSSDAIAQDKDIITTVNEHSHQSTSINVTLRHPMIFSGKRIENRHLVAADALVITLVHMLDSPVGRQWERKAEELALKNSGKWQMYPPEGRSLNPTLYEFRFQPLSNMDDFWLAVFYTGLTGYFLHSLRKLHAVKSRIGLTLAVFTQIAVTILSSFTVCAVLKIDLSHVPRAAYPAVIILIGLGNIFNLIYAVIMTPPQATSSVKIGEALGQTGHIALSSFAMNLILSWSLSKILGGPAITAMCAFASIAIVFDLFYFLTFFTPILSVDIQRTELSDALSRASIRNGSSTNLQQTRKSWLRNFLDSNTPFSTRLAGPIVMMISMVVAQWHFFENESWGQTLGRLFAIWATGPQISTSVSKLSADIHQAREPTAWLRLQDHESAHEVIRVIKPDSHSYIARVYDPLVFVLNGSDRTPNNGGVRRFLPAAYDLAEHQFWIFLLSVTIIVAAVALFLNYLLWNESSDADEEEREDDPLLSIKTLNRGHSLDILHLTTSRDGVLATVGLDRWIRIWDVRKGIMSYIVQDFESNIDPFPVLGIAIDNDSNWLAILSGKNQVYLWNIPERRWGPSMAVEMKGRAPLAFCFGYDKDEFINPLVVVRHNGLMSELHVESKENKEIRICRTPLVCVRQHFEKPVAGNPDPPPRIITSSKKGCVHIASQLEQGWISDEVRIPEPEDDKEILSIVPLPSLGSFLAVRKHSVDLIDIVSRNVTHTFKTLPMKKDSLRCFHSTRRRPQCGSVGLANLAIAYTCEVTGNVILQSYLPEREGDTICFRDPSTPGSKTCCLWRETVEHRFEVENPGQWEALQVGYLVGVRKRESVSAETSVRPPANIGLRRRGSKSRPIDEGVVSEDEAWEVWSISARGLQVTSPLFGYNERDHLLISELGPMKKVGKRSLAVVLGNIVKVITVGHENFDGESSNDDGAFVGMASVGRRKKLVGQRKKTT
jgi:hypothetical protein